MMDITLWICFFLHSSHGGGQRPRKISGAILLMVAPSSSHGPLSSAQFSCCRIKFLSLNLIPMAYSSALHLMSGRSPKEGLGLGLGLGRGLRGGGAPLGGGWDPLGGGCGGAFLDKAGK